MLIGIAIWAIGASGSTLPLPQLNQAVTYVIAEGSGGTNFVKEVLPKVGADVVLRGWFKWHEAPPVASWTDEPAAAHKLGALFGGGITCSALYDGENGLTQDQVRDMATRDPAGNIVDAWGPKGVRHGTLSNPAYIDYLFKWCKAQIAAGVDCLFMDERNAALGDREGYDDYALREFAQFLQDRGQNLRELGIDSEDRDLFPTGRISDFLYRRYLQRTGLVSDPASTKNPLFPFWAKFRSERDDRAFKTLTDRVRTYASTLGRTVYISGNGLDPYVDLQVLGVWNHWTTVNGHIDLGEDQIPVWHSIVDQGAAIAGRRVPVVLFHDWGFGNPGFPFMAVPLSEREIWLRTRAAEIYAAGGYFAFPLHGPDGSDASKDGSLPLIADLTHFYQAHRDLYSTEQWLGYNGVLANKTGLSLATSWSPSEHALAVHVINRNVQGGSIQPQSGLQLLVPVGGSPTSVEVISPDPGTPTASFESNGNRCMVHLSPLQAYSVVLLHFAERPTLANLLDPPRYFLDPRWERPSRDTFIVDTEGRLDHPQDLEGIVQGRLHPDLRNPPTFIVNFPTEARLRVHVRSVATQGARVLLTVTGGDMVYALLPDLDGKNDPGAKEYDRVVECRIPAGPRRINLDNDGPDWAVVDWLEFVPGR